jgi:hypothetical protein
MDFEEKVRLDYYRNKMPYAFKYRNKSKDPETFIAYRKEEGRLYMEFKSDLKAFVDALLGYVMSKDQFDAFFLYVWSQGHSSGYHEVVNCSYDLIAVIKKFIKKI